MKRLFFVETPANGYKYFVKKLNQKNLIVSQEIKQCAPDAAEKIRALITYLTK
jgi:hypothetical protein